HLTASELRGSSGLPIGGMGAIVDALATSLRSSGGEIYSDTEVAQITYADGRVTGVTTDCGLWIESPVVISAVDPLVTFGDLTNGEGISNDALTELRASRPYGSAFKIVLK